MDSDFLASFGDALRQNKLDELYDSLRQKKDLVLGEIESVCTDNYAEFISLFDDLYQIKPMVQTLMTFNDEISRSVSALQAEHLKLVPI